MERELTGMTQEALAERLNVKYHTSITPRIINIIESKGVIADANLRNVLLDDFYKLNLDRERKILAFAYNLADYLTDRKVSVDIPKLFSFTCRDELIQYVNDRLMESKKVKGLYFVGEVLDVDGLTGGFNLQIAWATARAAALSAAGKE